VGLLALAIYAFGFLENSFFPDSSSQQFYVHYWVPEGTDIRKTSSDMKTIEKFLLKQKEVESVASFVGAGAPRFMLVYSPEKENTAYGIFIVKVSDFRTIDAFGRKILKYLSENFPESNPRVEKIRLGPGGGFPIEARFSGKDPEILRQLSEKTKPIMREDGGAIGIRDNWRERVNLIRPLLSEAKARRAGVSRDDLARALQTNFSGLRVGVYREQDKLIPIISRAPEKERIGVDNIFSTQVWSPVTNKIIPLRQVVSGFKSTWQDNIIHRRNKKRTITTQTEPAVGNASIVLDRIKAKIEGLKMPVGYEIEWGGEYENSHDAQVGLAANLPVALLLMILVTIILFNGLRQPLIIWLTVPLSIIGVTFGLLITNESFGFMALLGFLSLSGMLIKNAIVLLDEIDLEMQQREEAYDAILHASVSRMRPVMMAAATTILGMIPLLTDVFFFAMAVTIMAGLAFATLLTLIVVPVFYAIFYRIKSVS